MTTAKPFGVSTAADVLSFIPHALGYWPSESLVFVTLTGGVSGATLRVDLPHEPGPLPLRSFVKQVRQFLTADSAADGTMVAMYTDSAPASETSPPHQPVMKALENELGAAGIPVREAWWVGSSVWRCYECAGSGCCPPIGWPVDDITTSMLNAELIFQGSHYGANLDAAHAGSPEVGSTMDEAVDAAVGSTLASMGAAWLERDQFTATLAAWQVAVSRRTGEAPLPVPDTQSMGFLLSSLNTKMVRDCLLVQISVGLSTALTGAESSGVLEPASGQPDVPDGLRRALKLVPTAPADDSPTTIGQDTAAPVDSEELMAFRDVLVGQHTGSPDWPTINRAAGLFQSLLGYSCGTPAAALLTMLAWIEWIKGRGSSAGRYVARSLEIDPEYELALLLDELFSSGLLPYWAMSPATAWRGGRAEAA